MPWNDNLIGPSLEIARTASSPLRVLAGPGTGKSYALMRRIWRLLEEGADPRRILVCTFTRTAAKDLEDALGQLGVTGAHLVKGGTLHALSFSILNRAEVLQLTGRVPRPLMDFETKFLIADFCEQGLSVDDCAKQLKAFNAAWARLQTEIPGWLTNQEDQSFDRSLREWLRFHQAMLIGELVPECRHYLRNNPLCDERRRFDHVLVDEYQDLNRAEQELLDLLAANGTLTVIGDENQSIYSFKHANPEGIVEFPASHANTTNQTLDICHRCPKKVVQISNALIIAGNPRARQLSPKPENPEGEIHIVQWPSIDAEARGIASLIQRRITAGTLRAGQVLILAPRRQFGYAIKDALIDSGIPAHSYFSEQELDGNPKILDKSTGQQAFTLLTLLVAPNDMVGLRCWCGFGSPSLRSGAWGRIAGHATTNNLSVRAVLDSLASGTLRLSNTADLVARYSLLVQREQALRGVVGSALLDALFPTAEPWAEPLRTLAVGLAEQNYSPQDLLETLRSGIVQPEMPTQTDFVRVMSLHKSKGLTAEFVVVVGLMEGLVPGAPDPHAEAFENEAKLAEARRVFYVALTRAKKTLILSSVTTLPLADASQMRAVGQRVGATVKTRASRFLAQLGPAAPMPIPGANLA